MSGVAKNRIPMAAIRPVDVFEPPHVDVLEKDARRDGHELIPPRANARKRQPKLGLGDPPIGRMLRALRRKAKLTVPDVAEKLGWSDNSIHRLEIGNGKRLDMVLFCAYCTLFKVKPSTIMHKCGL